MKKDMISRIADSHREDGPILVEWGDGLKVWYLNGNMLDPEKAIKDPELQIKYPELITSMVVHLVHNS